MLTKKQRNQILGDIGMVAWRPRQVSCLVLLSHRQSNPIVLEGMIKVLDLPPEKILRVIVKNLEPEVVASKIKTWQPDFILQLTMDFPQIHSDKVVQTYSPDHLAASPKDKAQAYKQLLELKELLANDGP